MKSQRVEYLAYGKEPLTGVAEVAGAVRESCQLDPAFIADVVSESISSLATMVNERMAGSALVYLNGPVGSSYDSLLDAPWFVVSKDTDAYFGMSFKLATSNEDSLHVYFSLEDIIINTHEYNDLNPSHDEGEANCINYLKHLKKIKALVDEEIRDISDDLEYATT